MMDQRIEKLIVAKLNQLHQEGSLSTRGYTSPEIIVIDTTGKLQVQTLTGAPIEEATNYFREYLQLIGASIIKEACLVLDCYAEPGQETTLPDIVVIIHGETDGGYQIGILEYDSHSTPLVTMPINWQNQYWIRSMAPLGREIFSHFELGY